MPCLERDVFLDDVPTEDAVTIQYNKAVQMAQKRGWAIAIGHPLQPTIEVLRKLLVGSPVRTVRLSTLMSKRDGT